VPLEGRRIEVRGTVQGVGFRPWVYRLAREEGIGGRVHNDNQGVTIDAFGEAESLSRFVQRLEGSPPPPARIHQLDSRPIPVEPMEDGFTIVQSDTEGTRRVSIPPDLATCGECLQDVLDPGNRRHGYPFTNCTHCGPRFTILRDVPYDRGATSMAAFAMCPECLREYGTPEDRRFHAEPNACPRCGPRLQAVSPEGKVLACADPIPMAARLLGADLVVGVKGLGGYQLACDATSSDAVSRLRRLKARDHKPFAVLVADLGAARRVARMSPAEESLLTSAERPIVLVARRPEAGIAPEVAPANPLVGLLLPTTPLHHLLAAAAARPLVLTSGNRADEPIVHDDAEAVRHLGAMADMFLVHDRPIEARCDDSVARVIAGRPTLLRRARGYVPRGIPVARPFARPVLACGGHFKNTFCIGVDDTAYLGPHVGDLETLEAMQVFEEAVARLERLLGVRPEVVAHDLHPGYLSTAYALARTGVTAVGVQHHHAHVASALAEHGLAGPVLGVAYDGTGYGADGTLWGGEILLADLDGFERLATLRPLRLAGGDQAVRQVWRLALALLEDAFGPGAPLPDLPLFRDISERDLAGVRRLLAVPAVSPAAHGLGRYFDALGALVLGRDRSHYDGQVALEWNLVADPRERGRYSFTLDRTVRPWSLDLRGLVREALADLAAGTAPALISARFHNTVAEATAQAVTAALERLGNLPVVLTGGCFQNALLTERVLEALGPGLDVRRHGEVPPGDGGLALGQALVADALARRPSEEGTCA
jgi:hydrogenase maturation protein HypF